MVGSYRAPTPLSFAGEDAAVVGNISSQLRWLFVALVVVALAQLASTGLAVAHLVALHRLSDDVHDVSQELKHLYILQAAGVRTNDPNGQEIIKDRYSRVASNRQGRRLEDVKWSTNHPVYLTDECNSHSVSLLDVAGQPTCTSSRTKGGLVTNNNLYGQLQ